MLQVVQAAEGDYIPRIHAARSEHTIRSIHACYAGTLQKECGRFVTYPIPCAE